MELVRYIYLSRNIKQMEQTGRKACRMFPIVLLNIVLVLSLPCCIAKENELCYLKRSNIDVGLCGNPRKDVPCCPEHLTDVTVTVYRGYQEDNCYTVNNCERNNSCCKRTLPINVSLVDIETLKQSFHSSNCFHDVNPAFIATSLPNSTDLELIVVSYSCTDSATIKNAPTISQTTQSITTEGSSDVDVAVTVSITIVVVTAVFAFLIVYLRRYRKSSNEDAIGQPQDVQTNNACRGFVSMSPGLQINDCNSTLAVDQLQGTVDVYDEIKDKSMYVKDFATEEDQYQTILQAEKTVNNEPANDNTKDKDPAGEDDYDHIGNQDTLKSQGPNEYEHITHIGKDGHSNFYDTSKYTYLNTNSYDECNKDTPANFDTDKAKTDGIDCGYSHWDGSIKERHSGDQYSSRERNQEQQNGSRVVNKYFLLEKQF